MNKAEYDKFKELEHWAATCQVEADNIAIKHIRYYKTQLICDVLQEYLNFNSKILKLVPWVFGKKAIDFVFNNHQQIKRKFELGEFINFCDRFRLLSMKYDIKDFEDFKNVDKNPRREEG